MTAERAPVSAKPPKYNLAEDDLSIEYPDSDGEPMAEDDHQLTAMLDAISMLRAWFADREDVYAGGDMLMYFRMNDNETRVAPDVFVVFGVESRHKRSSWIVWREGKAPDIVMELASGSTWRRDMREKRDIYHEMGVTEYWRFDPTMTYFAPPLIGERLGVDGYTAIDLSTDGDSVLRAHSAVLGLDVCVLPDGNLRLYDPVSRQWLRTHGESEAALQVSEAMLREAEAARERETAARQAAEEELRVLREQLQAYRAEQAGEE